MTSRLGKTLAELWPDVRVGDVWDFADEGYLLIDSIDDKHDDAIRVSATTSNGDEPMMWLDKAGRVYRGTLVAESVSAADFAPRYWSPERQFVQIEWKGGEAETAASRLSESPSAEACLEWAENNTVSKAMSGGGWIAVGASGDLHRAPTMASAIRAAMKAEKEERHG